VGSEQGVCELGQAGGVGDGGKAVAFLGEGYPCCPRGAGDVLVAVQDDLGPKGRVARHLYSHVAPLGVEDMEGVLVDKALLLGQVADLAPLGPLYVPGGRRRTGHQDHEHPWAGLGVLGQVALGDQVLPLASLAVDDGDPVGRCPAAHPS
jgi:hypothetical protein